MKLIRALLLTALTLLLVGQAMADTPSKSKTVTITLVRWPYT